MNTIYPCSSIFYFIGRKYENVIRLFSDPRSHFGQHGAFSRLGGQPFELPGGQRGVLLTQYNSYNLDNVHFNTKDGFVVEGALGHYFMPFLAIELEGGYLESTTSSSLPGSSSKLKVYPALATGKLLLPVGPIEPYGEFGLGVYFIDLDIAGTHSNFTGSTKGTFGYHAGGGVNINLGSYVFLGAEGRYRWATQSYGGEDIKLNGFTVTGDIGVRF